MTESKPLSLFVSLYTDEDVTNQLAVLLRQRGFEAGSASEVDMLHQPDEAHLSYATAHNMVLFSFNVRDYMILAQKWAAENRPHTGILLSDQFTRRQMGELLRRVLKFLNTVSADEMVNAIRYLSEFR
jgi:predicted nuclease of predicted toxin-antitoxin system